MKKRRFTKITAWLMVGCMLAGMLVTMGLPVTTWADTGDGQPGGGMSVTETVYGEESFTLLESATGAAAILTIDTPDTIVAGQPFDVTVTVVEDVYGNPGAGYTGTIAFASNDPQAQLPERYTFEAGDNGSKVFENVVFSKYGDVTLWVSEVPVGSPDAYWRFDEGNGPVVTDFSGNQNNGTPVNVDLNAWGEGAPGILFDNPHSFRPNKMSGRIGYVNAGNGINLAGSSFTIAFWAKRADQQEGWIVSQGIIVRDKGLHVGFPDSDTFKLAFWNNDLDVDAPTDNAWHHWTVTYDSSTNYQRVYLDGVEAGSRVADGHLQSSGTFYIGKRFDNRGYFNGNIDDLRVYYEALPPEDIAVLAGGGAAVSYWGKASNVKPSGVPQVLRAATNAAGTAVSLFLDQPMDNPAGKAGQFNADVNGEDRTFSAAELHPGNAARINLTLANAVDRSDEITVSYTPGDVISAGGGLLDSFSGQAVRNFVPSGNRIAAGDEHSLALQADGKVTAWGWDGSGGYTVPSDLDNVVALDAGYWHSLSLHGDRTVRVWGDDTYGYFTSLPGNLGPVEAAVAGDWLCLALQENGDVTAWGYNGYGERNVPADLDNVVAINAGKYHALALQESGTVRVWGWNKYGQCNVPEGLNDVVAIAAGGWHSLALKADGTVTAWGDNTNSQCNVPEGLSDVVAIAAGMSHSLALQADGTVVTWGRTTEGQGNVPASLQDVVAVSGGGDHSLALQADGTVVAWGDNAVGQCNVPAGLNLTGRLSDLQFGSGSLTPAFDHDTRTYTLTIYSDVESLEVTGTLENSDHLLRINGQIAESGVAATVALNPGGNIIPITVGIPGTGLTRTYTLDITRTVRADSFAVSAPDTVKAGKAFGVQLTALDSSGQPETNYAGEHPLDWSWGIDPAGTEPGASPSGSLLPVKPPGGTVTFTGGEATVSGFMLAKAGEEVTIKTMSGDGSGGESGSIMVGAGDAATLDIEPLDDPIVAGQPFDVKVTVVEDKHGNPGAGFTGTVAFAGNDPQAQLPARYAFQTSDTVDGVCSKVFSGLVFSRFENLTLWVSEVVNEESPDAYWRFDEGNGTVAADFSGRLGTGTLFNTGSGAWENGAPAIQFANPSGLKLDGVNDYLTAGNGINLAYRSFTIAFWAKRDTMSEGWIVGQGSTAKNVGLHAGFLGNTTFRFGFYHNDLDVAAPADTAWHHWTVTYDRDTGLKSVYLDGDLAGSGQSDGHLQSSGLFYIGKRFDNYGYFHGSLDDLRVYYRALPEAEIDVLAGGEGEISSWDRGITVIAVDADAPKMLRAAQFNRNGHIPLFRPAHGRSGG